MDLSLPSLTGSPASSRTSNYSRSPSVGVDYHSPDLASHFYKLDSTYKQQPCAARLSAMDSGSSHHRVDATTSAEWPEATVVHSGHAMGGHGVLPSDYAPYVSYDSAAIHAAYSHDMYSTHMTHAPAIPYHHASPLAPMPSRSPDPATSRHSLSYHGASPMPRIKMESGRDYASGGELSQYPSPRSAHALMGETSSYGSQAGSSGYLSDAASGSWSKSDYGPAESDLYYAGHRDSSASSLVSDQRPQQQAAKAPLRAPKRQTRKLTSKEEANFQCDVEGCGKLFSRSYNYKAHMETHDKKREYPFSCTYDDCTKKFVRKTDLQRHHQSVHMKEKNHKCDYCGRLFARKDTLRRHMEDGCSKRFDIGTMDLRGTESYGMYNVPSRPVPSSSGHMMAPTPPLPPMTTMTKGNYNNAMTDTDPDRKR